MVPGTDRDFGLGDLAREVTFVGVGYVDIAAGITGFREVEAIEFSSGWSAEDAAAAVGCPGCVLDRAGVLADEHDGTGRGAGAGDRAAGAADGAWVERSQNGTS